MLAANHNLELLLAHAVGFGPVAVILAVHRESVPRCLGARCGECVRHNLRLLDHVLQLLEDGVRHEGCALGVSDHMLTDEASPRAPCLRMMVSFL